MKKNSYEQIKKCLQYTLLQLLWLVVAILVSIAVIWVITMIFDKENDIVNTGISAGFTAWLFILGLSVVKRYKA